MNRLDRLNRELLRQARNRAQGNRLGASTGGHASTPTPASSTRVADGLVRQLWIPGFDAFDASDRYFGDRALPEWSQR